MVQSWIMTRYETLLAKSEGGARRFDVACQLCGRNHSMRLCAEYRSKSPEERLRAVLLHKYCPNCLSPFHRVDNCKSKYRCKRCNEKHHTTLHLEDQRPARAETMVVGDDSQSDDELSIHLSGPTKSWAQQVEEAEMEEEMARAEQNPSTSNLGTRSFRPLLQHERKAEKFKKERQEQDSWRQQDTELHTTSSKGNAAHGRPRAAKRVTRQNRNKTAPYQSHASKVDSRRALLQAVPAGFRTGRLSQTTTPSPIMRPFVPIAPTAVVRIESRGHLHLVRAIVDPCATSTIVDAELVRDLQLERQGSGQCTIILRGKFGSSTHLTTQASIVASHYRLSPPSNVDPKIAAPFQFMRLADPQFYRSSPIRLTLGADIYAEMMVSGTPATTVGGLLTQPTIFGLVVSGACQK
ncbi:uncharacterized protein [Eurosta solidaginis]|uniref:uncharacterized protein isoform X2 n=1 Tax=Eurosta solidaginis TaxID=178769 RepID=UPI0035306E12